MSFLQKLTACVGMAGVEQPVRAVLLLHRADQDDPARVHGGAELPAGGAAQGAAERRRRLPHHRQQVHRHRPAAQGAPLPPMRPSGRFSAEKDRLEAGKS